MRVITGKARGVQLKTPDGLATRPTSDRVKEALFSIIQFEIPGMKVLDLFAGSGQLGIEALSRSGILRIDQSTANSIFIVAKTFHFCFQFIILLSQQSMRLVKLGILFKQ